jgi:hypothetical protein
VEVSPEAEGVGLVPVEPLILAAASVGVAAPSLGQPMALVPALVPRVIVGLARVTAVVLVPAATVVLVPVATVVLLAAVELGAAAAAAAAAAAVAVTVAVVVVVVVVVTVVVVVALRPLRAVISSRSAAAAHGATSHLTIPPRPPTKLVVVAGLTLG